MKSLIESILAGRKPSIEKNINATKRPEIMRELIEKLVDIASTVTNKRISVKDKREVSKILEKLELSDYVVDIETYGMNEENCVYIHRTGKFDSILEVKASTTITLDHKVKDIYWVQVNDNPCNVYTYDELVGIVSLALDMKPEAYDGYGVRYVKFGVYVL